MELSKKFKGHPALRREMASGFISRNVKSVNSGARGVKEVESVLVAGGIECFCTQGNELLQILGSKRLEIY